MGRKDVLTGAVAIVIGLSIAVPVAGAVAQNAAGGRLAVPAVTPGYDARVESVAVARDVFPAASNCNHTGYLTYGIADLWLQHNPADANAKLASVSINQIGGTPKSCDPHIDQSRNNLALAYLIRAYSLYNATSSYFPGRLTAAAENNLVAQMWAYARPYARIAEAPNTWNIYDSENHDAEAKSFYFLAAQIFSHRADYRGREYADKSTVAQQYKAWHDHWSNYFDERAKKGLFIEKGSPGYHGYTLQAILNIYNFADDPVLRQKAGMILDLDFAGYAQEEFNGVWGGPKSRSYPADGYDGATDSMTNMGNLLFGAGTTVPADNHVLMLATSGYQPPPVVESLATGHAAMGSYEIVTRRPGYGLTSVDTAPATLHDWHVNPTKSVLDYAYATPGYVIGTTELWPSDPHVAPSSQNRWQGITFDASSDARIYPQAAPSGTNVCNDAFMSIQDKNTLITEKRTTGKGITQVCADKATLVYFPASLDSIVERNGWLFVTEGANYVAIRPANGGYRWLTTAKNHAPKSQRFIQLTDKSAPLIFEAAGASAFSGPTQFQNDILGRPFTYAGGVLRYSPLDSTEFTFFHDTTKAPKVDNHLRAYAPTNVFDSPFMQSVWGSGKITIRNGALRATYDFSNPAAPVKSVS